MTEKAEAWRVPANILRTMPYTAYTAVLGHGVIFAHAPSLHPSMAGSAVSEACSRVTIGAGEQPAVA